MSISIDKAVIARLNIKGEKFEILVDPEKALEIKMGKNVNIEDVLAYPAIYKNARASEIAPNDLLQKKFGTTDVYEIALRIIKKGEIQLTTEQRRKMIEQKKQQIAEIISKRGINPQTNLPHPPQRILNAMNQTGIKIDPFIDAELQVERIIKEIRKILPIKLEKVEIELIIPPQYTGKVYNIIKNAGEVNEEKWLEDGSLKINVEVLSGIRDDLFKKIGDITRGNFQSKIVKKVEV
ncbi:MAG: ribosome assembly factor SBDS [Candidatus Aenigmarchaeota archaeon]|nr:ribosome assembly factor SBDS [Candidatus Aenigmarchaeota archaeon]